MQKRNMELLHTVYAMQEKYWAWPDDAMKEIKVEAWEMQSKLMGPGHMASSSLSSRS